MKQVDVVVIGGGLLGCFAARNLCRWQLSVLLIEAERDVCRGISRANSAVVYAGYDNKPGSLKAALTVRGNARFDSLCRELEVPFSRCGSMMVAWEAEPARILEKKLRQGQENGVPGLKLLTGQEARQMEPMLSEAVTAALYAPTTGTVNPWQLGIAAYENAVQNGCETLLETSVTGIDVRKDGYCLQTTAGEITCRAVVNCAGLAADKVQELVFPPSIRLQLDAADYLVLDKRCKQPGCIIFHQDGACGKGITAIPCVEGNLMLSGCRRKLEQPFATTEAGLQALQTAAKALLPEADLSGVIRSFGAVRPNPHQVVEQDGVWVPDGRSIGSFCVENPAPGFFSLIGIKTPGLTCADELGMLVARETAQTLCAAPNQNFDPHRRAVVRLRELDAAAQLAAIQENPDYSEIVCLCEQVTKAEVLEAIRRGAKTVDGVKRRTGCTMGRCQGSRCTQRIEELLNEFGEQAYDRQTWS